MAKRGLRGALAAALCAVLAALLCGCGGPGQTSVSVSFSDASLAAAQSAAAASSSGAAVSPTPGTSSSAPGAAASPAPTQAPAAYTAPAFADSPFHEEAAQVCGAARLDFSALAQGYIACESTSQKAVVILVSQGESQYKYWLPRDGSPAALPLNMGSGRYKVRVMENISGNSYAATWSGEENVALADEFEPFLRPNQMSWYHADSACVAKAAQLAAQSADATALVGKVYEYLVQNVTYDQAKADSVQPNYLPSPDETLSTGRGICYDYASLAAAMLRSQGVPTRLITGYAAPHGIYHAWNQVYIEGKGWITVTIEARPGQWQRLDPTFAAGGVGDDYLTADANYTDRYVY